ncbi:MAG: hypothetical protein U5O39_08045 [Gammaproteobacteria bacterium]|nr:hypothetical protein [Gammaproteobacteria bacterium]
MQLSRVLIVGLLWTSPPWWLLTILLFAWGLNMGVTSTLARTIVQESADPQYRGRILSVFSLGMLGSAPIGAVVLGFIIEAFGTLNALVPSMIVSLGLFAFGAMATGVWSLHLTSGRGQRALGRSQSSSLWRSSSRAA